MATVPGCESFNGINSATDLVAGPFNSLNVGVTAPVMAVTLVSGAQARGGSGKCLQLAVSWTNTGLGSDQYGVLLRGLQNSVSTGWVRTAGWIITGAIGAAVTSISQIIAFVNAGTYQCHIKIGTDGSIKAYRGTPNTSATLLGTCPNTISPAQWNSIGVTATVAPGTAGSITVKGPGFTWTLGSQNTSADGSSAFTQVGVGVFCQLNNTAASVALVYLDDFGFGDPSCSAPFATDPGDFSVASLFAVSNGTTIQWTPLASTNASQIQETAMDSNTSYNASGTNGQIDTFNVGTISVGGAILGVQVKLAAELDAAGTNTLASEIRQGGTNYAGSALSLGTGYTYIDNFWALDPNTGLAWTLSGVNSAQYGYNRVS